MPKPMDTAARLQRAGKLMHDEIGPLLSAAGLRLQLIRMDFPDAAPLVEQVTETLDKAIDSVRALSQELSQAPDYSQAAGKSTQSRLSRTGRRKRK
jgi:signal transduction histidine kinase